MKTRIARIACGAGVGALLIAGCSACTMGGVTSTGEGSRATSYSSLEGLVSDSALVVVGTVESQGVRRDIEGGGDFTLSTVAVLEDVKDADESASRKHVVVRQIGSQSEAGPATLLETGKTYLLYLTPSGLSGDLASQYYVTGGSAGLYGADEPSGAGTRVADGEDATFSQIQKDDGDDLPADVKLSDAMG